MKNQIDSINIVTVYDSYNVGSALQATALYKVLEENGFNVRFLKTGSRSVFHKVFRRVLKSIKCGKITHVPGLINTAFCFKSFIRGYKKKSYDKNDCCKDIFVLGSDEIWNVDRTDMKKYPIFWGEGLPENKTFSYAPSINNSTREQIEECQFAVHAMTNLFDLSVRDAYTKKMIFDISGREAKIVCDPTLLLSKKYYDSICDKKWKYNRYVLVYGAPSAYSSQDRDMICKYAEKNDLKVLSFFFDIEWADMVVYGGPEQFVSAVKAATFVACASFHITLFSILYHKHFMCFNNSVKIRELVRQFNLDDRICLGCNEESTITNLDYDWPGVDKIIMLLRKDSTDYLCDTCKRIKEG